MNKAYKVVYNETTGTYVAVAEIESSRGKSTKSQTSVTTRESALNSFQWQPLSKISTLLIPILGGLGSLMVSNQASAIILEGDIACANGNTQTIVGPDGVTVYSSSPGNPIDGYLSPASTWSTVAGCGADGGEGTTTYASTLYGAFTKATGNFAVAMGFDARSAGSAVAIGTQARASSQGSVAIGTSAKAQNVNAVAVGTNTIAGNQNDVVIGNNITSTSTLLTSSAEATSKEFGTIAIGNEVDVGGTRMVVIGNESGMTVGSGTDSHDSIAIGTQTRLNGQRVIAIGTGVNNIGINSIAMGSYSNVDFASQGGTAVGRETKLQNSFLGTAIGNQTHVVGSDGGTAVGDRHKVTNSGYAAAFGSRAEVTDSANAIAIGAATKVTGASNGIAIGRDSATSAENGLALGTASSTSGSASIAIGSNSKNPAANSIALGHKASIVNAQNVGAIVIGDNARSEYYGAAEQFVIAIGANSNSYAYSVALGKEASADRGAYDAEGGSIAIGYRANTTDASRASIAMGVNSQVTSQYGVAIGTQSKASGANATAMGHNALASRANSIVIGTNAVSNGVADSTVVIGDGASSVGDGSQGIIIGAKSSNNDAVNSITIGHDASTYKGDAVVNIGYGANTSAGYSVTIGPNAASFGAISAQHQVTIGSGANTSAANAIAVGHSAASAGSKAAAFGYQSNASALSAMALGSQSTASGIYSVAVGDSSKAIDRYAIAMGYQSNASGPDSIAIGVGSAASGNQSIAVGYKNQVTGNNSGAFGDPNVISGNNSYALGNNNTISGNSTHVLGNNNTAKGSSSYIIGNNSSTELSNDIAIGTEAKTGISTQPTEGFSGAQVAIGYKATTGTDGQIALGTMTNAGAVNHTIAIGTKATTTGNSSIAVGRNAASSGLNAAAVGVGATAVGSSSAAYGTNSNSEGGNSVAIGSAAHSASTNSIALGNTSEVTANNAIAIGSGAVASVANSVALGNGATTSAAVGTASTTLGNTTFNVAGTTPTGTVSVGKAGSERTVTNVAAGRVTATSTDAINGSQLYVVAAFADQGLNFTANSGGTVNRDLGQTLNIVGSLNNKALTIEPTSVAATAGQYSARNTQTVSDPTTGRIQIQFADRPTLSGVVLDGKDGQDAGIQFGKDGLSLKGVGVDGKDGITIVGANGKDGITFNKDGTITNVVQSTTPDGLATNKSVDDKVAANKALGLNFTGNTGPTLHRDLGQTLSIIGSAQTLNKSSDATKETTAGSYYARNLQTVTVVNSLTGDTTLQMLLADRPTFSGVVLDGKDGKDASIQFGKDGLSLKGVGVDGKDGITIVGANGKDGITFNKDGTITNVVQSTGPDGLVTNKQLDDTKALGLNFTGNAGGTVHRNLGETLNIIGSAQGLNKTFDTATTGSTTGAYYSRNLQTVTDPITGRVQVQFADRPTLSGVVLDGKDGKDASIQFGKDGLSLKGVGVDGKDGITIVGANGKDGITFNQDGTITNVVQSTDPDGLVTNKQLDDTKALGLNFTGNAGGTVHRNLGETLNIIGSAQSLNKTFDTATAGSTTGEYYSRNLQTVTDPNTGRVQVQFADRPTLSGVVLDGKDGKDASVQFGKDGLSITGLGVNGKDGIGIQGMTGANGKDGISFNPDGTISNVTDGKNP
ncbi:ESPR-type extended signal peptide-containing protein, partial [Vitreoscilla stercoraria]